jgi:hypothetical protein
MSCRRAFEIDIAGFLAEPRAEGSAGFRDHYPRCRECSAEVRAWTELDQQLRVQAGSGATHPSASLLARYDESPGAVGPAERAGVERHLAQCPACRDELRALKAFAPDRVRGAAPVGSFGRRLRERLALLGRVAWHPGFAYALLALILLPTVYATVAPRFGAAPVASEAQRERRISFQKPEIGPADESPARAESDRERPVLAKKSPRPAESPVQSLAQREVAAVQPSAEMADRDLRVEIPAAAPGAAGEMARSIEGARLAAPEPEHGAADSAREADPGSELALRQSNSAFLAAPKAARRLAAGGLPPVRLEADRPIELAAGAIRGGLRLQIPLTAELAAAGGGELRLRVSDASGRRELRERLVVDPGATAVETNLPSSWLTPGLYRVDLAPLTAATGADPGPTYRFRIRDSPP